VNKETLFRTDNQAMPLPMKMFIYFPDKQTAQSKDRVHFKTDNQAMPLPMKMFIYFPDKQTA
jgi:hypothetical protein